MQPEQTKPETAVSQEAPDSMERAIERLTQPEGQGEAQDSPHEPEQSVQQEEAQGQAEPEEVTPDDIPEDQAVEQPAVDAFEIVHNGQQVKLSREETIKYAMQGFDYTQKTQAVAAKDRAATEAVQRLAEVEKIVPQIIGQVAEMKALEAQLAPYQNVNWPQYLAQHGTDAYAQARAQYDALDAQYRNASARSQQAFGAVKQQIDSVRQSQLAAEDARLPTVIPEWRDQAKREAGKAEVLKYLTSQGLNPAVIDAKLDTAESVAIVYKAMKYDQLVRSKADKSKTLLTVPGASNPSAAKAGKAKELQSRLKKTGSMEDAVALLLNR